MSISANLISIHSQEEWDFVSNAIVLGFTDNIWIGGYQKQGEKAWNWDDGSPYDWDNLSKDTSSGSGFCMYLWGEQGFKCGNAPCDTDYSFPFVCKM